MKTKILMVLTVFFITSIASYAQEVPKIVTQGFDAYKTSGFEGAFGTWLKGSPMESDKTTMMNLKGAFTQIETMFGKMIGHELLRSIVISPSTIRVYVEMRYERGPLFVFFDCYKSPGGWIIPTVKFQTEAEKILPDDFFRKK